MTAASPAVTAGSGPGRSQQVRSDARLFALATLARGRIELLQFFRSRDAVVFTLALPVVMLALLASVFSGTVGSTGVAYSRVYTAGLLAGGLASTSFLNLGTTIAGERDTGALKRLAGTPMPPAAYFLGKVILVLAASGLEIAAMLLVGHFAYGVALPASPGRWWTFTWVTVLGGTAMSLIGVAASSLPRTGRSAAAVLNLPFLVMEFLSGVFVPFTALSPGLYTAAGVFPLRWIAEGYRAALLPSGFARVEAGHAWNFEMMALVPALWCVVGLVVSARTFRWTKRGE
ncbi:MAG TPA: ABC transporter permease [Acidimicrobiales bacterium]|nr:ABC transporter permease [Acidimicrobiales bacterium]